MNAVCIRLRQWGAAAPSALWLILITVAIAGGCADEKVAEQSPEDFEKAREEHFEMMRRETGQATPAGAGQK